MIPLPDVNFVDRQVLALLARKSREAQGQPGGQTVDVSIFERYARISGI